MKLNPNNEKLQIGKEEKQRRSAEHNSEIAHKEKRARNANRENTDSIKSGIDNLFGKGKYAAIEQENEKLKAEKEHIKGSFLDVVRKEVAKWTRHLQRRSERSNWSVTVSWQGQILLNPRETRHCGIKCCYSTDIQLITRWKSQTREFMNALQIFSLLFSKKNDFICFFSGIGFCNNQPLSKLHHPERPFVRHGPFLYPSFHVVSILS